MERDDAVTLLGVDVGRGGGVYGVTEGLHERFGPERVIDTPIAEAGVLGAAVGAAMAGLRPVVEIMYMDFITVCLDPIVNQAAKLRYMTGGGVTVPIVFRTQTGGGRSGGAQHSQSLEGMLAHVPGLHVFCPADARDAYDLLVAAIARRPVPSASSRTAGSTASPTPTGSASRSPPGRPAIVRAGDDADRRHLGADGARDARARSTGSTTSIGRADRPAHARPARPRRRVRESVAKHGPLPHRPRGGRAVRAGRRDRRADRGARAVRPRRPDARASAPCPRPVPYSPGLEAAMLPGEERIGTAIREVLEV